ncbi:PTS sugar transporter subunit IIA [Fibrobacterota bacterium]
MPGEKSINEEHRLRLIDNLSQECIMIGAHLRSSKEEIIEILVDKLCEVNGIKNKSDIYNILIENERKISTGIGCGLAVPHAKVEFVDKMYIAAMSLKKGVDFGSIDKEPVFLMFLLISPSDAVGPHIRALSSICRMASDAELRKNLIEAKSPKEFYYQLETAEEKYA